MSRNGMDRRSFLKLGSLGLTLGAGAAGTVHAQETPEVPVPEPAGPVYRVLGRTKLKVAIVGIGAMRTSEYRVLQAAFDRGVNFVHTGRGYMDGRNQGIVAKALKGYRKKVYVATKVSAGSKEDMIRKIDESLAALEVDYVDIATRGSAASAQEVMDPGLREAMAQARAAGKVRFLGIPTHKNEAEVVNAVVDDPDKFFDVIFVRFNFKSDEGLTKALARAAKAGVGVVAMKTQAGGYATKELGEISPNQAALKWALRKPGVHMAIPAMVDLTQVKEDTEVMGMGFTTVDKQILSRYGDAIDPYYCRGCAQCDGTCPEGVDIATVNRSLMYAEGYRDLDLARAAYANLPAAQSAARCADCSRCVAQCVNGLDIASRMSEARRLFA